MHPVVMLLVIVLWIVWSCCVIAVVGMFFGAPPGEERLTGAFRVFLFATAASRSSTRSSRSGPNWLARRVGSPDRNPGETEPRSLRARGR